jgi:hypothetical protein
MLCVVEGLPLEDKVVEVLAHAVATMVVVVVTVVHRTNFLQCQLCGCTNISVFKCYKRFDPTLSIVWMYQYFCLQVLQKV